MILRVSYATDWRGRKEWMVWVVGGKKGENSQSVLRSGEVKRLDQEGARPKPISFCLHLGVPRALLCSDYQLC